MSGSTGEVQDVDRTTEDGVPITDVRVDPGGGALETAQHFGPPGEDSPPLPTVDWAACTDAPGTGRSNSVGYHDTVNAGVAIPGERKINARATDGTIVGYVYLQRDGTILLKVLTDAPVQIEAQRVELVSPDVRLSDSAGREVACVGDFVAGYVRALSAAPASPIVPVPPAVASPTGGVPFTGQIVSGRSKVKA
jgi:hypothetical protein